MKRILVTALAVTITLSVAVLPLENSGLLSVNKTITASADEVVSGDDYTYHVLGDGNSEITEHSYKSSITKQPTCTEKGYTLHMGLHQVAPE